MAQQEADGQNPIGASSPNESLALAPIVESPLSLDPSIGALYLSLRDVALHMNPDQLPAQRFLAAFGDRDAVARSLSNTLGKTGELNSFTLANTLCEHNDPNHPEINRERAMNAISMFQTLLSFSPNLASRFYTIVNDGQQFSTSDHERPVLLKLARQVALNERMPQGTRFAAITRLEQSQNPVDNICAQYASTPTDEGREQLNERARTLFATLLSSGQLILAAELTQIVPKTLAAELATQLPTEHGGEEGISIALAIAPYKPDAAIVTYGMVSRPYESEAQGKEIYAKSPGNWGAIGGAMKVWNNRASAIGPIVAALPGNEQFKLKIVYQLIEQGTSPHASSKQFFDAASMILESIASTNPQGIFEVLRYIEEKIEHGAAFSHSEARVPMRLLELNTFAALPQSLRQSLQSIPQKTAIHEEVPGTVESDPVRRALQQG